MGLRRISCEVNIQCTFCKKEKKVFNKNEILDFVKNWDIIKKKYRVHRSSERTDLLMPLKWQCDGAYTGAVLFLISNM